MEAKVGQHTRAWLSLPVFIVIVSAVAGFGALFVPGPRFADLAKPSWTPPNWLFGPVWTPACVMIAVAGWLVWRNRVRGAASLAWGIGLVLNAAWSWLLFGRKEHGRTIPYERTSGLPWPATFGIGRSAASHIDLLRNLIRIRPSNLGAPSRATAIASRP